jgi:hypothetical protein
MAKKPLDTQVPSEGAECLVQGMLCRSVIPTFKAPAFRKAYDLVAINPVTKKSATIQVKSRFQTDCDRSFIVRRTEVDFVVFVFLNMGNWYDDRPDEGISNPEYYVLPYCEFETRVNWDLKTPKLSIRRSDDRLARFRDAWHLVEDFLGIDKNTLLLSH